MSDRVSWPHDDDRSVADMLDANFRLLAEPDNRDAVTYVINPTTITVTAATPARLLFLMQRAPSTSLFEEGARDTATWSKVCPVALATIESAVQHRLRTDYEGLSVPVGRIETLASLFPTLNRAAADAEISGVTGDPAVTERRLRRLAVECVKEVSAIRDENLSYEGLLHISPALIHRERTYHGLQEVRYALNQSETHPRYRAYRATRHLVSGMLTDTNKLWTDALRIASAVLGEI